MLVATAGVPGSAPFIQDDLQNELLTWIADSGTGPKFLQEGRMDRTGPDRPGCRQGPGAESTDRQPRRCCGGPTTIPSGEGYSRRGRVCR
jgi:hypothetical protein